MFRKLEDRTYVASQIAPDDIAEAAARGVKLIINNRPDDEEMDQPAGADIEAAARAAGMDYIAIPVTQAGFSHPQIDAMAAALDKAQGPVLAYCRSGTRSTYLWALARAKCGDHPAVLTEQAAAAGYDLRGIRPMLDALSSA